MVELPHAIVLTGGIATGKSTTANLLKLYGFHVIDADKIAHEVLDTQSEQIAKLFGEQYVEDGKVLRKKLGALVFGNSQERKRLEHLLHPKIKEEITHLAKAQERFKVPYFIDIPLFYETKNYDLSPVVVVYAPKELQLERLTKRERLPRQEALRRIELQIDIEQKRQMADFVIYNSKDLKHLQNEVEDFVQTVKDRYAVG